MVISSGDSLPGLVPASTSPTSVRPVASNPWSSTAPAGGALVAAPRHSTKTRPAPIVAASPSGAEAPPGANCCGLALGSPRTAYRADVGARFQPLAFQDRLARVRAARDDVGPPPRPLVPQPRTIPRRRHADGALPALLRWRSRARPRESP